MAKIRALAAKPHFQRCFRKPGRSYVYTPGYQTDFADTIERLGDLSTKTGRFVLVREFLDKALAYREKEQDAQHLDIAHTLICLGE